MSLFNCWWFTAFCKCFRQCISRHFDEQNVLVERGAAISKFIQWRDSHSVVIGIMSDRCFSV